MRSQALQQIYGKLHQNQDALGSALAGFKSLTQTPLFDPIYYAENYEDVNTSGLEPLVHYLLFGAAESRQPHPLFDCSFYLGQLGEEEKAPRNALLHYLKSGHKKHFSPHPLFDPLFYSRNLATSSVTPLEHFLLHSVDQNLDPHPLFDTDFYTGGCDDVDFSKINPLAHYCLLGAFEGRLPHLLFHSAQYLFQLENPVIERTSLSGDQPSSVLQEFYKAALRVKRENAQLVNPILHYLKLGAAEERDPHPLFCTSFYVESNSDVQQSRLNPLIHFIEKGQSEHRNPHRLFDCKYYLSNLSDPSMRAEASQAPVSHYLVQSWKDNFDEQKSPHPYFDSGFYRSRNSDVTRYRLSPLEHYLRVTTYGAYPTPNKWLDGHFYATFYADVVPSGFSALEHYIMYGETQGRARNYFDRSSDLGWNHDFDTQAIRPTDIRFEIKTEAPAVSVILFGNAEVDDLCQSLCSIAKNLRGHAVEIISHSSTHLESDLLQRFPIELLPDPPSSQSKSVICNALVGRAKAPLLLFLSKNARPINNWYETLIDAFSTQENDIIIGSSLLTPHGRIKNQGCSLSEDGNIQHLFSDRAGLDPEYDRLVPVGFCEKSSLLVRRITFDKLSGFDTTIGSSIFEDADFAIRAEQTGVKTLCQSFSKVVLLNEFVSEGSEPWPLNEMDAIGKTHFLNKRHSVPYQ
jgi:hypothetical protein